MYKFKVIERGHPGVPGGGEKKFYASANSSLHYLSSIFLIFCREFCHKSLPSLITF
jgi:hypothetical protein